MKILLTGVSGYIGKNLLPRLLEKGHEVVALVHQTKTIDLPASVQVIEGDLLDAKSLGRIPTDIDAAYYLVHSMGYSQGNFAEMERLSAINFQKRLSQTAARQIIYLSGLANEEPLSRHLASRKQVDELLRQGSVPVTTLMAGIIIGDGSASFQIIRDLVEKLPFMIAPKWVSNLTQPIAIQDVLDYLILVLDHPACFHKHFEIGGPDILSYKQLLLGYAEAKGLKRYIISVPVFTPNLSSYWLYFITRASYPLSRSLVESLKNNAICKEARIRELFPKKLLSYKEAVHLVLEHHE